MSNVKVLLNINEGGPAKYPSILLSMFRTGDIYASRMYWGEVLSHYLGKIILAPRYEEVLIGRDSRLHITFVFIWRGKTFVIQKYLNFTGKKVMYYSDEEIAEMERWKEEVDVKHKD